MKPYAVAVANKHRLTVEVMLGRSQSPRVVAARQELWATLRCCLRMSYPEIGRLTSRDHTTVMHGVRRHWERRGWV